MREGGQERETEDERGRTRKGKKTERARESAREN